MNAALLRAGILACALLAAAPARAQTAQPHRQPDANGVDVTYGDFLMSAVEGSIGSGQAELPLVRNGVWVGSGYNVNGHQWDRIGFTQTPHSGGTFTYSVVIGPRYENFSGTGTLPSGSSLSGSGNDFVYRTADGTTIEFTDGGNGGWGTDSNFCTGAPGQGMCTLIPTTISQPDGRAVTIAYDIWTDCWGMIDSETLPCHFTPRINTVSNSFGYEIQFAYGSSGGGGSGDPPSSWFQRTGATFHNNTVSGDPSQASVSYSYPSTGVTQVTDMGGNVWRFTGTLLGVTGIRRPGASSDTTTIAYSSGPLVSSVTREGVATSYSRSVSGSTATMTITDAASHASTVVSDLAVGRPTSVTDPLSRQTQYQYDSYGRVTRVTAPEGNYVAYTYDGRGNVTETRQVAKSGSGLADIVTSATYASSCGDPSCNRPLTTTDARGYVTDYTYDTTHGGVLTVTAPAPSGSGTRPQMRYSYTLDTGSGVYRLTGTSTCQTSAATGGTPACATSADEVTTTIAYDANGNVTSTTTADGASTVSATTAMTYDALGDLLTVDGPLSGAADTVRNRYNGGRQLVGAVGPDPDGTGSLHHRARRITYTNGLPTRAETGTVNSQSDSDWASFSSLEQADVTYDANARPTRRTLSAGGTTYAVTDMSYDSLGRPDCAAARMNSSAWGTATAACTHQTAGSYGADRIARTTYDYAGEVTLVQTGYGVTGVQADVVATTYRNNGQVETVTDAMSNRTTYVYDGHDRLSQTLYPSATQGAGTSNTSDYEELGYDATGNIVSRRTRAGQTIAYTYDALNRLTGRDLPSGAWYDIDRSYAYDNLGRLILAAGNGDIGFSYDALGRLTAEAHPLGTTSYQYDSNGRRTRLTWPDGFYVTYDYDDAGELLHVRENGATSGVGVLATYSYDDRGRRTGLSRGNGTTASYSYDNADRLTQLVENLSGSSYDLTLDFGYDPAGRIASNTRSNDAYAWGGHYAVNRAYTADGLNRYTATGAITPTYDANGNMTAAGSVGYSYNAENRLVVADHGSTHQELIDDSMDRLYRYYDGAANRYLTYDGQSLTAEWNAAGTAIARRYVHGPSTDEPLVWYEGSGTSDRRFLHADERGSIVATSDSSGAMLAINSYGDYGIPASANSGRFQYTGQAWLPEIGMYYYRARIYSPSLGRFMQTDPIGFGGGMNIYAYVHNDPVNFTDPSGTDCYKINYGWYSPGGEYYGPAGAEVYCFPDVVPGGGGLFLLAGGPTGGPGTGNGGDDGDGERRQSCSAARNETGRIVQVYASVNVGSPFGGTVSGGYFFNWSTGTHGYFVTLGAFAGGEADVGGGAAIYRSLADMAGFTDSLHVAWDPAQGSLTFADILRDPTLVAGSLGSSFGAGGSLSRSYTFIFWCSTG